MYYLSSWKYDTCDVHPRSLLFSIPDPGSRDQKASDPGFESATLLFRLLYLLLMQTSLHNNVLDFEFCEIISCLQTWNRWICFCVFLSLGRCLINCTQKCVIISKLTVRSLLIVLLWKLWTTELKLSMLWCKGWKNNNLPEVGSNSGIFKNSVFDNPIVWFPNVVFNCS